MPKTFVLGQQDIDHVTRAFGLLRPGGRLVAIMGAGASFNVNLKGTEFRALVERFGGIEANLPDAFKPSGTSTRTVTVVLDRPHCDARETQ